MEPETRYPNERSRRAVLSLFIAQGLCFASWASRIPDIKEHFDVQYAFYWGLVLFLIPVGKFLAIPLAGWLVSRLKSRVLVQASVAGYAFALFGIGCSASVGLLGGCLLLFGVCWNLCDISLNTQGIGIERCYGRTIMATFHAGWSLAACAGALLGFGMIVAGISPLYHFSLVTCLILLAVFIAGNYLPEEVKPAPEAGETVRKEKRFPWFPPEKFLLQLGVVGLFALIVESAMFDWSGIYFESALQVPKLLQIGFLVFMVMMAAGRFLTNYAYRLLGKRRVIQLAGSFIFGGFFLSAFFGEMFDTLALKVVANSVGFMLVGLGISCMVPTIYSLVGMRSETPVGMALTILSGISFAGSLVAPLLIGAITQAFTIRYAYLAVGVLGLCIVLMATFSRAFRAPEEKYG